MSLGPSASPQPFLQLRGVSKAFGKVAALNGLDLDVRKGELLALVGPSGCGKTTALRVIAGLEPPDFGEVLLQGKAVNQLQPGSRDVAMVFQDFALYPHLTAFDNIAFGLRARRLPAAEVNSRVAEIVATLNFQDKLERLPHELSGGEQQRLAIARALARHPALLLMDEPLANLDPGLRAQFRADLSRLRARFDVTIVYVTHDQAEAMALGDRVAVMCGGRILQSAPPTEVYRQPANLFVAGFLGIPPINFLRGHLKTREDVLWFEESSSGGNPLQFKVSEETGAVATPSANEVVLGIRPEHVRISGSGQPDGETDLPQVLAVQFAGHEYYVTIDRGAATMLVARVSTNDAKIPAAGDRIGVTLDTEHALFFDTQGNALAKWS